MNDVQRWLQDADPVRREPGLSVEDARQMRCAVLAAAEERPRFLSWRTSLLAVATVAVVCAAGVGISRVWNTSDPQIPPAAERIDAPADRAEPAATRQLQFATPGGTRVIWTFNPNFKL